jgi:hypothetical protein
LALFVLGCLAVVAVLGLAESSLAELAQLTITGPDGATIDGTKVPTAAVTFTFATTNFQASSFTCLLTRADSPLSPIPADPPDCSTIESPSTGGSVTYENLSNGPYVFKVDAYSTEPKPLTEQRTFTVNVVSGGTDGGRTPTVAIKKHPATSTQARTATFTFVAVPPDAHLRCWLDSRQPTDCVGEQSYGKTHQLRFGSHTFHIEAVGGGGDRWTWKIEPASAKHSTNSGFPFLPTAGGVTGFLVVTITGSLIYSRHRFRVRLQLKAEDEEPHGPCHGDGWRCKKELTLKPARRRITYLAASATDPDGTAVARNFECEAVDRLNDAVARYRHAPADVEELRRALLPIASSLRTSFDLWLSELPPASRRIVLKAHLEGGKMETAFTPYRCEHGEWKPHRRWSHEFADERDEDAAVTSHPGSDLTSFVAHLAGFVAQVDIQGERSPTARAVPHL